MLADLARRYARIGVVCAVLALVGARADCMALVAVGVGGAVAGVLVALEAWLDL